MGGIHDSGYSWARLGITLALAMVGNVGMWAVIVVMPAIEAEFGTTRAGAALPYTLCMLGFAVGNLVMGRAVDRWGAPRALAAAALMISSGFALCAMSPSMALLSAAHVLLGLGAATFFGPLIADISHWFMRRRGIAVSIAASGNYLAGAIWPLLLAPVLETAGWRAAYLVIAAVVVTVVLPGCLLLRRRVPAADTAAAETAAALAARRIDLSPRALQGLLALAGIACCVAMSMPQVHIVSFCVDLGYGPAVGSQMLSLMLAGGVVSRLASGLLADRLGGVTTLLIGSTLQMLALILYLPTSGLTSLYLVSLVFGLSQGGIVPAYAIVIRDYLPAREAGARIGLVMMATIVGMALGGWMSGWIYDATGSYHMAFLNGIGWNLLNMAIVGGILFRSRSRPRPLAA
jgi:MFS family permease